MALTEYPALLATTTNRATCSIEPDVAATPLYATALVMLGQEPEAHELLDAAKGMTLREQRKLLTLTKSILSGAFMPMQASGWSDAQLRAFVRTLTETFTGIEEGF